MPLDINALKSKLSTLKGNNRASTALWKPKEGKQVIRIVPSAVTPDNPFTEMYFYYWGNRTIVSPLSYGLPDPINDFGQKIRGAGDKESYNSAKPFLPKMRTYAPIIVRGAEDEGVKFWAFGKTVYEELLAIIADPDYGDITDPMSGRDVIVEFTPQDKSDTNFAQTKIRVKPNQTPITNDSDLLDTILEKQPDLKAVFPAMTREQLEQALGNYVNPDSASSGPVATSNADIETPISVTKTKAIGTSVEDINEKFDKIFDSE